MAPTRPPSSPSALERGLLCGAFNGALVTRLGLPSIVVTIGTMSLFRGISYIVLGDQAFKGYPPSFAFFGQGYVWWVVSFEFVLFLGMALVYYVLLHRRASAAASSSSATTPPPHNFPASASSASNSCCSALPA